MKPILYALAALALVAVYFLGRASAPATVTVEVLERTRARVVALEDSLVSLGKRQADETRVLVATAEEAERIANEQRAETARLRRSLAQVTNWRDFDGTDADLIRRADSLVRALLGPGAYVQATRDACVSMLTPPGSR